MKKKKSQSDIYTYFISKHKNDDRRISFTWMDSVYL